MTKKRQVFRPSPTASSPKGSVQTRSGVKGGTEKQRRARRGGVLEGTKPTHGGCGLRVTLGVGESWRTRVGGVRRRALGSYRRC